MKLRSTHAVIAVMAAVIVVLAWALVYYSRDELGTQADKHDDEIRAASSADVEDGRAVVRIAPAGQKAAGIEVQTLRAAKREAAYEAYGIVMNLQPLADLRGRYLAAIAESRAARAMLAGAESEYRRMESLFRDDRNVSEQAMKSAQARYQAELARQAAADQAAISLRDAIRGSWGEAVTRWAIDPDSQVMRALLAQSAFLVQIVFPYELPRTVTRDRIAIAPAMARDKVHAANFVGGSPQVDPAFPGETYFYLVNGTGLRSGMRISARIRQAGAPVSGVIVPAPAVVWHAGKAWAYVKEDEQTFARFEVSTADELEGGWFNPTGFDADDEVVVSGAQLLLSEELKYQIRNENED